MKTKHFPLPGSVWAFRGTDLASRSGPHTVVSLRWFHDGRIVAMFDVESCADVEHMMTLDAWECLSEGRTSRTLFADLPEPLLAPLRDALRRWHDRGLKERTDLTEYLVGEAQLQDAAGDRDVARIAKFEEAEQPIPTHLRKDLVEARAWAATNRALAALLSAFEGAFATALEVRIQEIHDTCSGGEEVSFGPGDLVAFPHRDGLAVGYVDSVDIAANVVASLVRPGAWKERGNLSLAVSCWRVALDDLQLLRKALAPEAAFATEPLASIAPGDLIQSGDTLADIDAKVERSGVPCPVEREWMDAQIARSLPSELPAGASAFERLGWLLERAPEPLRHAWADFLAARAAEPEAPARPL